MKETPLARRFFEPAADVVASKLLGHWLIRNTPQGPCGGAIVETEAYLTGDEASHTFRGETARNRVMWGPPGYGYVYYIYGNHWCFNAVCQRAGIGEAVLIRALEPTVGLDGMRARRPVAELEQLTSGPGKLCAAMNIDRAMNGVDLCDADAPLFIMRNPDLKRFLAERGPVVTTTRIGITRAAERPLRFYLEQSAFVSRRAGKLKVKSV